MGNPLEWIAAIGGVLATIGAWMGPVRARWNLRVEQLRTEGTGARTSYTGDASSASGSGSATSPRGMTESLLSAGSVSGLARPGHGGVALTLVRRHQGYTAGVPTRPTGSTSSSCMRSMNRDGSARRPRLLRTNFRQTIRLNCQATPPRRRSSPGNCFPRPRPRARSW